MWRVKNEVLKTETKPEPAVPIARYSENFSLDQRIGRDTDRKDHWLDTEKTEMQRSSWRKENRRNDRETEKQQERRPEPETWHKPVEQAKPYPPNDPGLRFGKAATALELAQSFSKSISDTKTADRFSSQRGQPGQNQVPFSRLTDTREFYSGPKPRHQINGYWTTKYLSISLWVSRTSEKIQLLVNIILRFTALGIWKKWWARLFK